VSIIDIIVGFLNFIKRLADAIGIHPLILLGIVGFLIAGWHDWATRYLAKKDMEKAIRKSNQPPPLPKP
jgi:hypothetical protein